MTDMRGMFCTALFSGDISKWDVSKVTDMRFMFWGSLFNGDVSHWNVSSDATLDDMFSESPIAWANVFPSWYKNTKQGYRIVARNKLHLAMIIQAVIERKGPECDLNHIDVSRVTDMSEMFSESQFNGDISQWDVSNVTDMSRMFYRSAFDGDISQWNVSNVTNMAEMFKGSQFNGDTSQWNMSNVTNKEGMFDRVFCLF